MSCCSLSQVASSTSCSLPPLLGVYVCGFPAGQRLWLTPPGSRVDGSLPLAAAGQWLELGLGLWGWGLVQLPAVPVPVRGVQLSLTAAALVLFSGSSPWSPTLLRLLPPLSPPLLLLLPVARGGANSGRRRRRRSHPSLSAVSLVVGEGRGGGDLQLRGAGVSALGHGEVPQPLLLVAGRGAGGWGLLLLLGGVVGDRRGCFWAEVVANATGRRCGYRGY